MNYEGLEMGSDEYVLPRLWQTGGQKIQWNLNEAANLADGWRWGSYYRYVGQCHLFMNELFHARAISEEEKVTMKLKSTFCWPIITCRYCSNTVRVLLTTVT